MNVTREPITIFENHDSMIADRNFDQFCWFVNLMADNGFAVRAGIFKSRDYEVDSLRVRTFGVIVEFRDIGLSHHEAAAVAQSIVNDAKSMAAEKMTRTSDGYVCRKISDYLLPPDDEILKEELRRLKATKNLDMEAADTTSVTWPAQISQVCKRRGVLPSQIAVPSDVAQSPWCNALPLREQRGLRVHLTCDPSITNIDTSQSIPQMTMMSGSSIGTIIPSARIILRAPFVKCTRPMLGQEKLAVAGIPKEVSSAFREEVEFDFSSDVLFSDLAGNAFQAEILGAFFLAVMKNLLPKHIAFLQRSATLELKCFKIVH